MGKGVRFRDIFDQLPKERQDRIMAEFEKLNTEYLALQQVRQAAGMTQTEVADAMDMAQSNVSKLENQTDLHVSTLKRYVEALGGELHISATLPGKPPIELTSYNNPQQPSS